ncbi:hypothetical protein ACHAWF_017933 [Thalassiosira exigua]
MKVYVLLCFSAIAASTSAFAPAVPTPAAPASSTRLHVATKGKAGPVRKSIGGLTKDNFSSTLAEIEPFLLEEAGRTLYVKSLRRLEARSARASALDVEVLGQRVRAAPQRDGVEVYVAIVACDVQCVVIFGQADGSGGVGKSDQFLRDHSLVLDQYQALDGARDDQSSPASRGVGLSFHLQLADATPPFRDPHKVVPSRAVQRPPGEGEGSHRCPGVHLPRDLVIVVSDVRHPPPCLAGGPVPLDYDSVRICRVDAVTSRRSERHSRYGRLVSRNHARLCPRQHANLPVVPRRERDVALCRTPIASLRSGPSPSTPCVPRLSIGSRPRPTRARPLLSGRRASGRTRRPRTSGGASPSDPTRTRRRWSGGPSRSVAAAPSSCRRRSTRCRRCPRSPGRSRPCYTTAGARRLARGTSRTPRRPPRPVGTAVPCERTRSRPRRPPWPRASDDTVETRTNSPSSARARPNPRT